MAANTFGRLIRSLRMKKGMTLEAVANKLGSHKGYISGIENGKVNPPSVKFIKKLAHIFGYTEGNLVVIGYVDKAPAQIHDFLKQRVQELFTEAEAAMGTADEVKKGESNSPSPH